MPRECKLAAPGSVADNLAMRRRLRLVLVALLVPACAALATERRDEPETDVPVILPPPPGAVPEAPPPPTARQTSAAAVPFAAGQTWVGQYACPPGPADASVRIESVRGTEVAATFQLANGRYALEGRYDPASGALDLVPTRWLEQSPTAPLVGLYGTVSPDASVFEGRMTDPTCRWFSLRSPRP